MKRIVLVSVCLSFILRSFSQNDSTNYEKLLKEFHGEYIFSGKDNSKNFFNELHDATNYILRMENPLFKNVKKDFVNLYHLESDVVLKKIVDSIILDFNRDYLWENLQAEKIKWQVPLSLYSEKICSCISPKLVSEEQIENLSQNVNNCLKTIGSDISFTMQMNNELKNASYADRLNVSKYSSKYLYENCFAYHKVLNNVLYRTVAGNYFSYKRDLTLKVKENLIHFYKENKTDSLSFLFPDFKKYEKDIKASLDILMNSGGALLDSKPDGEDKNKETRTETFYTNANKITGQIIYSYQIEEDVIIVLTYKFLPSGKIPDKHKLEEELVKFTEDIKKIDVIPNNQ